MVARLPQHPVDVQMAALDAADLQVGALVAVPEVPAAVPVVVPVVLAAVPVVVQVVVPAAVPSAVPVPFKSEPR